ncbi:phosphoadenosine phosphosulfate reductase [Rhodobaculum claviforme]|uniref:Phosphoadenosine phosphosulfate reductase n=1 Tax=Rhodobaculum claviforme TaxID=1549854 RepID=A0A934TLH5_9RHOB|nr:phosphoadenosine phosphosulfate reductase [Rhodobaculum claviforme]MBK5928325.1 hypothetical protein [Rhodobaculum claviforme]
MQDPVVQTRVPGAGQTAESWLAALSSGTRATDELTALGMRHAALLRPAGPVLLVSFDTLPQVAPPSLALAGLVRDQGWSHLSVVANGATWWRDPAVHAHFDRLIDEGFFETFDRVVFFGIGMGGYAAASFCVAAPGCAVVAIRPQATLQAPATEWDRRFPHARRLDFTDRYSFAPDMVEGAASVLLVYDPRVAEDAMHAALFTRPHVLRLRCHGAGARPEVAMAQTGLVAELLRLAARGALRAPLVHRAHRAARRRDAGHLLRLLSQLTLRGRGRLARRVARAVLDREDPP